MIEILGICLALSGLIFVGLLVMRFTEETLCSPEKMEVLFERGDADVRSRVLKLETLQYYDGDPGFDAYFSGDLGKMRKLISDMFESQMPFYSTLNQRGVVFDRIRIVEKPISNYTRFEFLTYRVGTRYGERVFIADRDSIDQSLSPLVSHDFVAYDNRLAIFNSFDSSGKYRGGWFLEDQASVEGYVSAFDRLRRIAVPLGHYEILEPLLLGLPEV